MSSKDVDTDRGASTAFEADGVGPTIDLADVSLPTDVGEGLQTLYGTDEPPRDAETWIAAQRAAIQAVHGRTPTVDDLCAVEDGDHSFEPNGDGPTQDYICVLDPLAYPFITDTPGLIKSTTQVREETVTVQVTDDGVLASHLDAVVSIGVSNDVEYVEEVTPEVVYRQVCGFIHVFADEDEYETWAADVDGATTSVPLETGIGLAKAIAGTLFEAADEN